MFIDFGLRFIILSNGTSVIVEDGITRQFFAGDIVKVTW